MSKYLTIAEMAEQADIPNSTCRRYLTSFEEFFLLKGGSRLKKYEANAIEILIRIQNLYEDGMDTNEIHSILVREFPIVVNGDEQREVREKASALATNEDIAEIKQALVDQKQFNKKLLEQLEQQNLYYEKKFEELKGDRDFIGSLRNSMEQRKIESVDQSNKTKEQLDHINRQLTEIKQNGTTKEQLKDIEKQLSVLEQNKVVKELTDQVATLTKQLVEMQRETAVAAQELKKGPLSRISQWFKK